jgi:hypothetical protein
LLAFIDPRCFLEEDNSGAASILPLTHASPTTAAYRLVFPIVLTPYGIATVITLLAASK